MTALILKDVAPGLFVVGVVMETMRSVMSSAWVRLLLVLAPLVLWFFSLIPADGIAVASDRQVGREVFLQNCAACHITGVAKAPRVSNIAEWEPRLATGRQNLLNSVLRGNGGMPPKGGNASISDGQATAALDYLIGSLYVVAPEALAAGSSDLESAKALALR